MQGTMLWFNVEKGYGLIQTEHDERLYVTRGGFLPSHEPQPRCKGQRVSFERHANGGDSHAVNVAFVPEPDQRRARLHRGRGG
jgi:cold shock CspA family protein